MTLVGDREREAAALALRRHYLQGRLTTEQLNDRVELAVRARDRRDLRAALAGLPPTWRDLDEVRRLGRVARRGAIVAGVGVAWLFVSVVLLVAFAISAVVHGVTTVDAIAFPLAWAAATFVAWHVARRA